VSRTYHVSRGRLTDAKLLQKRGCDASYAVGVRCLGQSQHWHRDLFDLESARTRWSTRCPMKRKSKGWTVDNLNANGDPSQAIVQIKQLVTMKADAIIVTVFDSTGLAAGLQAAADAKIPVLSAGGGMAPGIALRSLHRRRSAAGRPDDQES
jgi:hypothetical protein